MTFTYPEPGPTYDVRSLRHRLRRDEAEEDREQRERDARGGPCRFCGVEESWVIPPPEGRDPLMRWIGARPAPPGQAGAVGLWHEGGVCAWCSDERVSSSDDEHRDAVIRSLVGDEARFWYPRYLIERTGFRWFHETRGARGGRTRRFAYVDRDALRARLAPAEAAPGPDYLTRHLCPTCGVGDRWLARDVTVPKARGSAETRTVYDCHACLGFLAVFGQRRWTTDALNMHVARSVGVGPSTGLAHRLGVGSFADSGLTTEQPHPFAWWPPLDELRRRALRQYPDERQWSTPRAYALAREAAARVAA